MAKTEESPAERTERARKRVEELRREFEAAQTASDQAQHALVNLLNLEAEAHVDGRPFDMEQFPAALAERDAAKAELEKVRRALQLAEEAQRKATTSACGELMADDVRYCVDLERDLSGLLTEMRTVSERAAERLQELYGRRALAGMAAELFVEGSLAAVAHRLPATIRDLERIVARRAELMPHTLATEQAAAQ